VSEEKTPIAKIVAETIADTPTASPSNPSNRFTAFVTPTSQRRVRGNENTPRGIGAENGKTMVSICSPEEITMLAAVTWTTSFPSDPTPWISS
jgi:hypothetical protein